jgi:Family of unknown function (DUF5670)
MLAIIAAILFVLWILGFLAFHVTSGLIHIQISVRDCRGERRNLGVDYAQRREEEGLNGGEGGIQARLPKKFSVLMVNFNPKDFNRRKG